MKVNCPLDYELLAPSTGYFEAGVLVSGEKKFGNRVFRYTLKDLIQKTPGVYDLSIKAIAPTVDPTHVITNTFKFDLTKNC